MNPIGVLTAADLAEPGDAAGTPLPRELPAREVMQALAAADMLPVEGGGRVSRSSVLARLVDPQG